MAALRALSAKGTALLLCCCLSFGLNFGLSAPVLAQVEPQTGPAAPSEASMQLAQFPFNDQQPLTPEQIKIQKYKLERLRIQALRDDWFIIRGINEQIDDMTLLKMSGRTAKIEEEETRKAIGGYISLGGLVVAGAGGLLLTDLVKFQNSFLVAIGLLVVGGAAAIGGELWAGNLGDENGHLMDRSEAELLVKEHNAKLKKELGLEHIPTLD